MFSLKNRSVYLTFNEERDDITLGFFVSDAVNKDWKLKITRIPCSATEELGNEAINKSRSIKLLMCFSLAPANCLQYMTKDAGQIESFNFRQDNPATVRQLANQNYNICFKRKSVITWYIFISLIRNYRPVLA